MRILAGTDAFLIFPFQATVDRSPLLSVSESEHWPGMNCHPARSKRIVLGSCKMTESGISTVW